MQPVKRTEDTEGQSVEYTSEDGMPSAGKTIILELKQVQMKSQSKGSPSPEISQGCRAKRSIEHRRP